MKRLLRHSRIGILVGLLALTGLALVTERPSAAHAASYPTISATGGDQVISMAGTGFTPKGSVLVEVHLYNPLTNKWHLEAKTYVTALGPHFVCRTYPLGPVCAWNPGGQITAGFVSQPGTVHVVAYDFGLGIWSNRVTRYVYPIP